MSEQSNDTGLGNVAYVVRSVEGATAIARGNITNSKIETVDEIHNRLMAYDDIKRENDELREALREILKVSESTSVLTYQKMEDIASKALKETK